MIWRGLISFLAGLIGDKGTEHSQGGGSVPPFEEGDMWLFVGLGNPTAKYTQNRHNAGFMVLDAVAREYTAFSPFRSKFQGQFSEGRIGTSKILLLKPETYMNLSGQSVIACLKFYKIPPEKVIVFHDELDLASGVVRVKCGGGNAGHNGLKSIQQHLGTPDFWRVRVGIGRPPHKDADVSAYVLDDFSKAEREKFAPLFELLARKVDLLLSDDPKSYEKAVNLG